MDYFAIIGYGIIFFTHVYMLVIGLPESQIMGHAVLNLGAGGILLYNQFWR
ncbi:hypothetical protein J4418_04875 [Candidatus Woesearchaeota archaeon]|nr:hypothetical protein [Candidatus Woesearchaeota archaeon]